MKSMKITAAERKAKRDRYKTCSPIDGDVYPYGLSVLLENDSIDKLDLKSLPDVGATMALTAKVKVVSVESREHSEGGKNRSISLQIVAMNLTSAKDAVKEAIKNV